MNQVAAAAWRFRTLVERCATVRFASLADRLHRFGDDDFAEIAARASEDERRHALLCSELATSLGALPLYDDEGWEAPRLAPSAFDARQALAYEVLAQCCIAETESMATLSVLMAHMPASRYRDVVREIARDEASHAQLGWAYLERHSRGGLVGFLQGHLTTMVSTGGEPLFRLPTSDAENEQGLIAFGVLPHDEKRAVFVETLRSVVVPGFQRAGLDTEDLRRWVE